MLHSRGVIIHSAFRVRQYALFNRNINNSNNININYIIINKVNNNINVNINTFLAGKFQLTS